jgi:predicted AlkP superfamily pyrophosphatase or phosphodiesterase
MNHRSWTTVALTLVASCSQPPSSELTPRVLLIGLDGVRVDILESAATPNIDALRANGTFTADARTRMPTVSGPGWSSMTTGVWSDKHGVMGNDFSSNRYVEYPDFLTRLETIDSSWRTMVTVDWPPLGSEAAGGPMISPAVDELMLIDGDDLGYEAADSISAEWAAEYLHDNEVDAAFVYLGNVDVVGHETSSLSDEYRRAIETADAQVGRLVAAVRSRPTYESEDWLILMSTDHGRADDGSHGGPSEQERTIFYLTSGPSAQKGDAAEGVNIVDVAVTALEHLGIEIQSEWGLDGEVVGIERR